MIRNTLSCVLCTIATLILLVCALRYVTDFWPLAFVYSLQTHITLACSALILLCLAIRRSPYAYALLVVAVFLTGHSIVMMREFAYQAPPEEAADAPVFRLMSFNILNDNFANGARIADMIIASQADVVYVFESAPLSSQLDRIAAAYPYRIGCGEQMDKCDTMILSRRPFVETRVASLSDLRANRFVMADIDLDGQIVHFAAAHLTKPYFDDYHQSELLQLSKILRKAKGPLILAGDFNSSMIAPDMQKFLRRRSLNTANGEPSTWPTEAGRFGIAIDHVFARAPLTLTSVTRIDDAMGSNHYGLMAEFLIRK